MGRSTAPIIARRAFTLLESILLLGILSVLFLLSLCAIQRVRMITLQFERTHWHKDRFLGVTGPRHLPIKILFIGNSYTAANDLPGMLLALSKSANAQPELIVDSQIVGGATLKKHWDDGVALQKINATDWDFVVLQEQSQTPLRQFGRDQLFYPYARLFAKEIRRIGAIPLFFMTWARPDTPGPQAWWTNSYVSITKSLNAECAPAGMAFEKVKQSLPHIQMFQDKGGHPTPQATYLIACVFYATIYDKTPEGLPNQLTTSAATVTVAPNDATAMQRYAWQALQMVKRRINPGWRLSTQERKGNRVRFASLVGEHGRTSAR